MGQYLTAEEVRERFAGPLLELAAECKRLCDRWDEAEQGELIARPDLLLNNVTSQAALGTLRKFFREASGKLDDAIAGVYRYRKSKAAGSKR
jgi:hypothetical protein